MQFRSMAPTPEGATTIINAVVDEYMSQRSRDDTSRAQRVVELLEHEKGIRGKEVQRLRENSASCKRKWWDVHGKRS